MITDAVVSFLSFVVRPVVDLLPAGHLPLPSGAAVGSTLSGLDSLVPILGVLRLGALVLSLLAVFFLVRAIVFLRYLLLP